MAGEALLRVRDLEVVYRTLDGEAKAVDRISLTVGAKECVAIIGESGSGKSTVANAILRTLPENARISGGQVAFRDKDLLRLPEAEMRKVRGEEIAMVFQDPHSFLNPVLRLGRQLEETIRTHRPDLGRQRVQERAIELLSLVRIPDPAKILRRYPHQLSGGMAQRVGIALALSSDPKLLIADEPTSALDLTIQAQIVKLLQGLREMLHLSVLLITHDLSLVSNIAERVYVMCQGKVVEEGSIDRVYREPAEAYTRLLLGAVKTLQGLDPDASSGV